MHAVADPLPEVPGHDKWIGKTGWRGCCHFIPRVADLVVIGVHDAAGTLLSILSTFILSTGLFLILRLGRSMSQTRGSHSSLRQSHLKSETGQRREKNIKIRFICFFLP